VSARRTSAPQCARFNELSGRGRNWNGACYLLGMLRYVLAPLLGMSLATTASVAFAQDAAPYEYPPYEYQHPDTLDLPEGEESLAREPEPPEPVGERFDFDQRRLAVGAMLGFGTPVGLVGVVAMYTPVTPVSLGVGAGTNDHGLQLSAMATLRPFSWARRNAAHAISLTPAWSTGPWKAFHLDLGMAHDGPEERAQYLRHAVDQAHWLQFDGSYELMTRGGFWLRAGYGAAWMLNPGDAHCEFLQTGDDAPCQGNVKGDEPDSGIITVTIVLGTTLDV